MKIQGIIESVEQKTGDKDGNVWKRAAYKINKVTYSTFDEKIISAFKAGDSVEIEYEDSGPYHNIKDIKKLSFQAEVKSEGFQTGDKVSVEPNVWLDKDRRITRLASLKTSVEMLKTLNEIDPEKAKEALKDTQIMDLVMNAAGVLESWVFRGM